MSLAGSIGLHTYLIAGVCFAVLTVLSLTLRRVKPIGLSLFFACLASTAWALTIASSTATSFPPTNLVLASELIRDVFWIALLLQLLSLQNDGAAWTIRSRRWLPPLSLFTALALILLLVKPLLPIATLTTALHYELVLILWLLLSLVGLVLLEQLFRNASGTERWSLKHLCIGLGAAFAFDFFMYAEALLFRQLDAELWQARGLVVSLVTPLFAISMARNTSWHNRVTVSRQVVFHTVTLMGAGLYLLGMALIGYVIRFMGGTWGHVLQVGFLAGAGVLLVTVLFSGKVRAQLRVLLSKHFFSYRYDYREEWLKFTRALAALDRDVPEGIVRTMARLVDSPAGLLWARGDGQGLHLVAHWEMPPPTPGRRNLGELSDWLSRTDWVIDLHEWRRTPDLYTDLQLPQWIDEDNSLWLIVPLVFKERLEGVLMLRSSPLKQSINWEDRDLLKTAGRQAASHLAQHMASKALVEARQFEAFNRLSAYVVHDLKNILAQQSLMVANATKHRHNPAFIDDMIATVENSVNRMQRLMEQMRTGMRDTPPESINLGELLRHVVAARSANQPVPVADFGTVECFVTADPERLYTVFNHLVQNAQEATDPDGEVRIRMLPGNGNAVVEIADTGCGMSEEFLRDGLFRAFESTKGLTGMGIGAFESREYVRHLGGDIQVSSEPGVGSLFKVTLPDSTTTIPE